jgi:hypothetical protein
MLCSHPQRYHRDPTPHLRAVSPITYIGRSQQYLSRVGQKYQLPYTRNPFSYTMNLPITHLPHHSEKSPKAFFSRDLALLKANQLDIRHSRRFQDTRVKKAPKFRRDSTNNYPKSGSRVGPGTGGGGKYAEKCYLSEGKPRFATLHRSTHMYLLA